MAQKFITILNIRNTGNQPLQIDVTSTDSDFLSTLNDAVVSGDFGIADNGLIDFGADNDSISSEVTSTDLYQSFSNYGLFRLIPGHILNIEQYRVNLGQVYNYVDARQARVVEATRVINT